MNRVRREDRRSAVSPIEIDRAVALNARQARGGWDLYGDANLGAGKFC